MSQLDILREKFNMLDIDMGDFGWGIYYQDDETKLYQIYLEDKNSGEIIHKTKDYDTLIHITNFIFGAKRCIDSCTYTPLFKIIARGSSGEEILDGIADVFIINDTNSTGLNTRCILVYNVKDNNEKWIVNDNGKYIKLSDKLSTGTNIRKKYKQDKETGETIEVYTLIRKEAIEINGDRGNMHVEYVEYPCALFDSELNILENYIDN